MFHKPELYQFHFEHYQLKEGRLVYRIYWNKQVIADVQTEPDAQSLVDTMQRAYLAGVEAADPSTMMFNSKTQQA